VKLYKLTAVGVTLAAFISCWQAADAQTIQVIRPDGGFMGTAAGKVQCLPPMECGISRTALTLWADAGTASKSWLCATLPCPQGSVGPVGGCWASDTGITPGTAALDHITFKTVWASSGSAISLDTSSSYRKLDNTASTGRFTLATGKSYFINSSLGFVNYSSNNGNMQFAWFNADNGTPIGNSSLARGPQWNADNAGGDLSNLGVITTSASTRVELRLTTGSGVSQIGAVSTHNDGGVSNIFPMACIWEL